MVPGSDTWETEALETLELTDDVTQGNDIFALRVKGQSMIDAFIDDGDIVLMEPANTVNNGDMVAAWIKDRQEVTLKKLYREDNKIRLQPANSQMEPIYADADNVEVQGKVIGVIRKI
jgi:repressor LexA